MHFAPRGGAFCVVHRGQALLRRAEGGASYVPTDLGHVKIMGHATGIRPTYEVTHVT